MFRSASEDNWKLASWGKDRHFLHWLSGKPRACYRQHRFRISWHFSLFLAKIIFFISFLGHPLACIIHCFRHMLHCSLLVPQCAARRQSKGSGAAKERLSGVRELGTLHEREESQFMEEVGERGGQVHSGYRRTTVESIKPHRQAAMLLGLWGSFSCVYGKTLLLQSSRGYLLPSEANGSRWKKRNRRNDKPLVSLNISRIQPWCMALARCLWKSLTCI